MKKKNKSTQRRMLPRMTFDTKMLNYNSPFDKVDYPKVPHPYQKSRWKAALMEEIMRVHILPPHLENVQSLELTRYTLVTEGFAVVLNVAHT